MEQLNTDYFNSNLYEPFKEKIDWIPNKEIPSFPRLNIGRIIPNKWTTKITNYQSYMVDRHIGTIMPDNIPNMSNSFTEMTFEIKDMVKNDKFFNKSLRDILTSINYSLNNENNYKINVQIEQDIEIPDWKEVLILIKLPRRDRRQLISLWRIIEERARKNIKYDINKNITIIVEELDQNDIRS